MSIARRLGWTATMMGFAVTALVGGSFAQQEKTERFVIELRTQVMGLPFKLPNMEGMQNMPNIPGLTDMLAPKRIISGEATYPTKAVEPIFATVPTDLALPQNKLVLRVSQPAEAGGGADRGNTGERAGGGRVQFTSKLYWGCGTAKGPIENSVNFDPSQFRPQRGQRRGMQGMDWSQREVNDRTATGSEMNLPPKVVGKGPYVLNTNGAATLDGFLPPVKVTQPESLAETNLENAVPVSWDPVPGARGYILHAMGMVMQGQQLKAMVQWVSTATQPPARVFGDYEQETSIGDDLQNGILLPAGTTSCTIPAGIFKGMDYFTLNVTAVGNDYFNRDGGLTVVGKIRSKWTGMKSKEMQGMQGMGGE